MGGYGGNAFSRAVSLLQCCYGLMEFRKCLFSTCINVLILDFPIHDGFFWHFNLQSCEPGRVLPTFSNIICVVSSNKSSTGKSLRELNRERLWSYLGWRSCNVLPLLCWRMCLPGRQRSTEMYLLNSICSFWNAEGNESHQGFVACDLGEIPFSLFVGHYFRDR